MVFRKWGFVWFGRLVLAVACLCSTTAFAQYRFDHWTADNGLPQNSVRDILQTRDGYLWLATFDGLVRFDGVRFTVFNKSNSPGLVSNRFLQLYEDGQGALWASTENSGVTWHWQGRFTTYTAAAGLPDNLIRNLGGDGQGRLLCFSGAQLWRWAEGRFQLVPVAADAAPGKPAERDLLQHLAFESARQPYLFAGAGQARLLKWTDGTSHFGAPLQDRQGRIWCGSPAGLYAETKGQLLRSAALGRDLAERPTWLVAGRQPLQAVTSSADGSLWLTDLETQQRQLVAQLPPASLGGFPAGEGELFTAYSDREGNLWLGTLHNGLYRLHKPAVTNYGAAQGLRQTEIYPIHEARTGAVWLGGRDGMYSYQDGVFTPYPWLTTRDGLGEQLIHSLFEDRAGRIWANGRGRLVDRHFVRVPETEVLPPELGNCWVMYEDPADTLWFGTERGVVRDQAGVRTHFTTKDGLAGDDTKVIIADGGDGAGGLWLGSYGGLTHFKDGRFSAWTERDGLPGNTVRALKQDADGTLWIGTYDSGLGRFKEGRFTRYTTNEGLFDNGVFQILADDFGWLWMSCNRGIYRVRRQELDDFATGKSKTITSVAFGKSDGMENAECNGGRSPAGFRARDGKLWFPTMGGVAVIDPASVTTNAQPPPVVIEAIRIDNQALAAERLDAALRAATEPLQLAPRQNNFEIQYTALSFIKAETLQFKYKLEGQDPDWIDAGTRRAAYYSYLPPGDYTFRVIAANRDGVWNTAGQSLRIRVLPAFYRTWWFRTLALLAFFGAVFGAFRYRVKQLEERQAAQQAFAQQLIESQEAERQRIAAELHDGLGQNLIIIKNWAALGLNFTAPQAPVREQLQEISETALQSLKEVREIINNLRPHQLETIGIGQTLKFMCEQAAAAANLELRLELAPLDGVFAPADEVTFFRLVQEGLNNILKHAQATHAAIVIERGAGTVRLTMEDNGRGFDPAALPQRGGFGLKGLAERARQLGGAFRLQAAPGQGTKITITIDVVGVGE
jgi:signal transduction histidine kinase/ligand-binding sensor domain-containing protein